MRNQTPVFHLF